jgi:solute carrier family 25 aspartate/glutamate transporter 12/13
MPAATPPPSTTNTTATTTTPSTTSRNVNTAVPIVVAVADNNNINNNKSVEEQELIRLALHRSPYFTCLTEEQVDRFVQVAELRSFRPGQAVILEGCRDDRDDEEEEDYLHYHAPTRQMYVTRRSTLTDRAMADPDDALDFAESDDNDDLLLLPPETAAAVSEKGTDAGSSADSTAATIHSEEQTELVTDGETEDTSEANQEDYTTTQQQQQHPPFEDHPVPPPSSGTKSYLYVIRQGNADVLYENVNPASLGPGTLFGEGGFLFGRQHSASIVASSQLECYVVDHSTFIHDVLESNKMKLLFDKYAHHTLPPTNTKTGGEPGERYMTMEDFIRSCSAEEAPSPSGGLSIANTYQNILRKSPYQTTARRQEQIVRLTDFCLFHLLMARPDPEVDIAFLLMDRRKAGNINLNDFQDYLANIPYFDMQSEFVVRHFGKHGNRTIRTHQFSQFLVDLQREMGRQAFLHQLDTKGTPEGFLPPREFVQVLKTACGWRLSDGVAERLECMYCKGPIQAAESTAIQSVRAGKIKGYSPQQVTDYSTKSVLGDLEWREKNLGTRYFAYVDFLAFQEVLGHLPGICNLIDRACQIKKGPVSPDDFKVANRVFGLGGRLSRKQVDIIFQLFDLDRDGFVSAEDAASVTGLEYAFRLEAVAGREGKFTFAPPPDLRSDNGEDASTSDSAFSKPGDLLSKTVHYSTQFLMASIAGGIGILSMYPLDLVKTRMMNQRIGADGSRMYLQSFDCLRKTVRYEGFMGLYRGLLPPLLAVGPEKAIKFAVNDLLRGLATNKERDQKFHLFLEIVSGGCAGACQLLVTNPLELIKIRMQMHGETARLYQLKGLPTPKAKSFSEVAAELGMSGLYRGAAACLLRDIPFGAIYFPAYAACKDYLVNQEGGPGSASASTILIAGTMAGIPASFFTTPADMVKTRLQVLPRRGEVMYSGIGDCFKKVYATEGPTAFFKGSLFRVGRIAPQFGIALLCYEYLTQSIGMPASLPPTNAPIDPRDYRTAFPTHAIGTKTDDIDNLVKNMGFQSRAFKASPPDIQDKTDPKR